MENKNSQKLVRDNIPHIIQREWRKVDFYKADEDTFWRQLSLKLLEEAQEVAEAKNKEELIEEIADVFEVIDSMLHLNEIKMSEIRLIQEQKRIQKWGFENRYILRF